MNNTPPIATDEDKRNWEVEKLRKEVRNLSRTFIIAVVLAVFSVVATIYQLYGAITSLENRRFEETKLNEKIAELGRRISDLDTEREQISSEITNYKEETRAVKENPQLTPQQKFDALARVAPTFQLRAPETVPHANLPARVYLQYLDSQKDRAFSVIRKLEESNYTVRARGVSGSVRQRISTVLYYYENDEDEAKRLLEFLRVSGVPNVSDKPTKLEGSARPRHYDVWLAFPD